MSQERLARALARFDELNAGDPTPLGGRPRELVNAERLSAWLLRVEPEPSEALRLASRCQHLMRWKVKRGEFPEGRAGYHAWRRHMAGFHADLAAEVLREVGYDETSIGDVRRIVLKQGMQSHADVQHMEDALCLSFLEHELADFAGGQPEDKLLDILRQTWRKMSPRGQALAKELVPSLPADVRALVGRALG
ncbi:MAG: DUF4202 domain-containing protein [Myxococcales bacterium]|nr:DUF4202 domain-containing protein [Myxococcales bacterium]